MYISVSICINIHQCTIIDKTTTYFNQKEEKKRGGIEKKKKIKMEIGKDKDRMEPDATIEEEEEETKGQEQVCTPVYPRFELKKWNAGMYM